MSEDLCAGQLTLVTVGEPQPVPIPVRVRRSVGTGKPRWTRIAKAVHRCDDCMAAYVDDPRAPVARMAKWSRKDQDGDLLLCYAHAQPRRETDNMAPLKSVS